MKYLGGYQGLGVAGGMRVTVSFWGDENGLDLGNSDGCRTS